MASMTREEGLAKLRRLWPELGVAHVSLFGSLARGEDTEISDIDIAVVLRPGAAYPATTSSGSSCFSASSSANMSTSSKSLRNGPTRKPRSAGTASMPTKRPAVRFQVLGNISRIRSYTTGLMGTAFRNDLKTQDAVETCLGRISEAAVKLGDAAELLAPDVSWDQIRALGNRLRHGYDTICHHGFG
jgi:uncharacterized protein with HEPN domain